MVVVVAPDWLAARLDAVRVIDVRVQERAAKKGTTMARIALAWQFGNDRVDAPIVGTTSVEHLEETVDALEVDLAGSDVEYLEEPFRIAGHAEFESRPPTEP